MDVHRVRLSTGERELLQDERWIVTFTADVEPGVHYVYERRTRTLEHEYVLIPNEGRGFSTPATRKQWLVSVERFLAKHLGGRSE